MKKYGRIILSAALLLVVVFVGIAVIKLITGALSLLGGALDTILGIAVIIALIAIVIWMFSYAKRH